MPIFEFTCPECENRFEELVRSSRGVDKVTCPECGSRSVEKLLSTFSSSTGGGRGKDSNSSLDLSCATRPFK